MRFAVTIEDEQGRAAFAALQALLQGAMGAAGAAGGEWHVDTTGVWMDDGSHILIEHGEDGRTRYEGDLPDLPDCQRYVTALMAVAQGHPIPAA